MTCATRQKKALLDLLTLQGMRQRDQVKKLDRAELGAEVHGPVVPWDPPAGTKDVLRHSRLPQRVRVFSQRLEDRAVSIDFVELDEVPDENPFKKSAVALPVFEKDAVEVDQPGNGSMRRPFRVRKVGLIPRGLVKLDTGADKRALIVCKQPPFVDRAVACAVDPIPDQPGFGIEEMTL